MIADNIRLTPLHCKKHTASFARSTGNFLVIIKAGLYAALQEIIIVIAYFRY